MNNHYVKKEDFADFHPKSRMCAQHGRGKNKAIDVVTDVLNKRVWYEFTNQKTVVYSGPDLEEAIQHYNKA